MYQIDNLTAVAVIPASTAAGTAGFFTDGNPATGVPATIMPAEYQNMLMMEIINVLTAAGITPSKSNFTQLLAAIKAVNRQTVVLADTGTAGVYSAVNVPALTALPATGHIQRINIAHQNPGASTYSPDGLAAKPIYGLGLQPLQGGELPVGVAVLMYLVQAGVNGGNGAWVIIESLGGASQVAPATQSQHAVNLGQAQAMFSPVVGSMKNASLSVTTASASATFTADEVIVETALGGQTYRLASYSQVINLATTGAGGMDTGTAPVSGFVALYAIYNPATAARSILAVNATAAVQPPVYGGANMPSGYTASALISVLPTTAASLIAVCQQTDNHVDMGSVTALSTSTVSGGTTFVSTGIPKNARMVGGSSTVTSTAISAVSLSLYASEAPVGQKINNGTVQASGQQTVPFEKLFIKTPQTIRYASANGSGTPTFIIVVTSYDF